MANDMVRVREPGQDITGEVTAAIIGKRFLRISAARAYKFNQLAGSASGNNHKVAAAIAGGPSVGVSKYDQPVVGGKVGIARAGIVVLTAGAAITAGQRIMSDATGQAVPWATAAGEANVALGYATDDAANGTDVEVAINLG